MNILKRVPHLSQLAPIYALIAVIVHSWSLMRFFWKLPSWLFVVEAKRSPAFKPFALATIALRKANYKLIYYTGYEPEDSFELYDMEDDPEELRDLYPTLPAIAKQMREELLDAFWTANEPYGK